MVIMSILQRCAIEAAKNHTEGQVIKKLTAGQSSSAKEIAESIARCVANHEDIDFIENLVSSINNS